MLTAPKIQILTRSVMAALALFVLTAVSVPEAHAQDRNVTIINDTNVALIRFYGSNIKATSWGRDHLGSDVIPPGGRYTVNFDDGTGHCHFDFKAVFADDDELEERNVNVCEIGSYRYYQ